MRRLVWLGVVIALLWSGWWTFAAYGLRNGAQLWLQDRRNEGWQADTAGIDVAGFPTQLALTFQNPAFADPDTGVAFETDALRLSAPAWWPGYLTVSLPTDSFTAASPIDRISVVAEEGVAALRLNPGAALELEHAGITSGPWQIASKAGPLWAAQALDSRVQQSPQLAEQYEIEFAAPAFTPGEVIRDALRAPDSWPVEFDSLSAHATVTLDRPLDRLTIESARPQPRAIDLHIAQAEWGALLLRASADLDVSEQGLVSGDLNLQARNWQDIVELAERSGALPSTLRPQVENILSALARGSGNPDTLDLTLKAQDGSVFLGFVPLGTIPPLFLR